MTYNDLQKSAKEVRRPIPPPSPPRALRLRCSLGAWCAATLSRTVPPQALPATVDQSWREAHGMSIKPGIVKDREASDELGLHFAQEGQKTATRIRSGADGWGYVGKVSLA